MNAVFLAIHPTTYRGGGFLAHGILNKLKEKSYSSTVKLNLTKGDNGWTVDELESDGDFVNAACGNLVEIIDSLNSEE